MAIRHRTQGGSLLLLGLVLAGCGPAVQAEPTPTATASPSVSMNQAACDAFSDTTASMSDALNSEGNINDAWGQVRDSMDAAALEATGDVKERLATLVDEWPNGAELWMYQDFDRINQLLRDVGRACEADDASVDVYTFVSE